MHFTRWAVLWAGVSVALAQPYVISTVAGGVPPPTPVPAVNASLPHPGGIAVDSTGNQYFTSDNCVFKIDLSGTLTRVAGNSRPGFSGDGGLAINAQLDGSYGVAVDAGGNLYIADAGNNRIRMVSSAGIITTVAGAGSAGSFGDGGPATQAQLNYPLAVAVDSPGNLYIADSYNQRIRKVGAGGIIGTVAGDGTCCYSGDGGPAVKAQLHQPDGVATDAAGNLYIADLGNNRIRKVTAAGVISTLAGTNQNGYSGDGGPATSAQLAIAWAVAVDPAGNVYIADSNRIRKVSLNGSIATIAGQRASGYSGDGGPAVNAQLDQPVAIAVDAAANLYIADTGNNRIRELAATGVITTLAGDGTRNYSGDGGPAAKAQLYNPEGLFAAPSGKLYFADYARIRMLTPGGNIATVAGDGISGYSTDGIPATGAHLSQPEGVALDAAGNLYIADSGASNRIRKVTPDGTISTLAGNGTAGYSGDGGPAVSAQLNDPEGVALDAAGNLYIADSANGCIRKVTPDGAISTVVGNGTPGFSGDGGAATSAQLSYPRGVTVDTAGNLYIADFGNGRVRKVSPSGAINTIAGGGTNSASSAAGNPLAAVSVSLVPQGVAVDSAGNVFIADFNNLVWKVSPNGAIATVAGNGTLGYSGDNGDATRAQLSDVRGVAVDASGNVYFSDTSNSALRQLRPVPVLLAITTPSPLTSGGLGAAYSQTFAASGGTPPYTWSVIAGALPAGLALSGAGVIGGVPTVAGISNFTLQATDSTLATASQTFSLTISVPGINTLSPLIPGAVGLSYSVTLSASGGTPPYNWSLPAGSLPPGLALSPAGVIGGIPSLAGSYNFTVKLTDAASLTATQSYFLTVASAPALTRSGVLAHIAAGGGWNTTIYLANTSTAQLAVMLVFHADDGTPLNLPLNVTQQTVTQQTTAPTLTVVVNPNATLVVDTGAQVAATVTGWVDVLSSAPVNGFAIFRQTAGGASSEGTTPFQTQFEARLDVPYDNRAGFVSALALANLTTTPTTITATLYDSTGMQLGVQSLTLPAAGHTSFLLPSQFPATAGLQGMVQLQSSAGNLAGVGLRASPQGTFTSVPVILP